MVSLNDWEMIETPNQLQSRINLAVIFSVPAWQCYLFNRIVGAHRYLTSKSACPLGKILIVNGRTKQWWITRHRLLEGNQNIQWWIKLSSLNVVNTVKVLFTSFWCFYVNLKVWDPNLKAFSFSFSKPQDLWVSEVGRSAINKQGRYFSSWKVVHIELVKQEFFACFRVLPSSNFFPFPPLAPPPQKKYISNVLPLTWTEQELINQWKVSHVQVW